MRSEPLSALPYGFAYYMVVENLVKYTLIRRINREVVLGNFEIRSFATDRNTWCQTYEREGIIVQQKPYFRSSIDTITDP